MIIEWVDCYRDGGTITIKTDEYEICIDHRIATKTPFAVYQGYPDKNKIIQEGNRLKELLPIIKEARDIYGYNRDAFNECIKRIENNLVYPPISFEKIIEPYPTSSEDSVAQAIAEQIDKEIIEKFNKRK